MDGALSAIISPSGPKGPLLVNPVTRHGVVWLDHVPLSVQFTTNVFSPESKK